MPSNVETLFSVKEVPWHGLGTIVKDAPTSKDAIRLAGLDWIVEKQPLKLHDTSEAVGKTVVGFKATVRSSDNSILGIVSDRYKVIQNNEAFAFTDSLLSEGVTYETAGSLNDGKRIWLLARVPEKFKILGDDFENYLIFTNSHDGSSPIRVALTPVRIVCQNTLNLALQTASRSWSAKHLGNLHNKMDFALETLGFTKSYDVNLEKELNRLYKIKLSNLQVENLIKTLLPIDNDKDGRIRIKHIEAKRDCIKATLNTTYDLKDFKSTAYGFVNAVSDAVTHTISGKEGNKTKERLFSHVIQGHDLIDKSYDLVKSLV